jgi:hypothetical protein
MQAVFHSRAVFQGGFTVQLAVFACMRGRHVVGQATIDIPDATRASCSFCRQNGSWAELALALRCGWHATAFFFCRQKLSHDAGLAASRVLTGSAMPKPKLRQFSFFS